jgi:hypothetical protein
MKRSFALSLLTAFAASAVAVHPARAQAPDAGPPKIIHKPNPHEIGLAPPTGGTSQTSPILNHLGPVIPTPGAASLRSSS